MLFEFFNSMKFSREEVIDLVKAWLVISLAFALVMSGSSIGNLANTSLLVALLVSAITVGTGFLLHELAHKFYAQKYGCWAEFVASNTMLLVALLFPLMGVQFIFAAPGAVVIDGYISRKKYGIISIAGPITNIIIGIFFLLLGMAVVDPIIALITSYGTRINFWLAFFNMLPIPPLDGSKVLAWDKTIYFLMLILCGVLAFAI